MLTRTIRPCWTKSNVLASGQSDHVLPSSLLEYLSAPTVWPRSGAACDNCGLAGFIALCEITRIFRCNPNQALWFLSENAKKKRQILANKRSLYNNHYIVSDTLIQIILGLNFFLCPRSGELCSDCWWKFLAIKPTGPTTGFDFTPSLFRFSTFFFFFSPGGNTGRPRSVRVQIYIFIYV